MTDPVVIYVHVPFCIRKCNYCDFCSYTGAEDALKEKYTLALLRELREREPLGTHPVKAVFFGGGTPTLLGAERLVRILGEIRERFSLLPDAEVTVEANPASMQEEGLAALREGGFNRLSIGVQSFSDRELSLLGRVHSAKDAIDFFHAARRAGFRRINLDLMYGIPEGTLASWRVTLETALSLSPEHISAYGLMLAEGTPFYEGQASLALPGEEAEAEMYLLACRMLKEAGYSHYEISNYAKPGEECRHNLQYWHSGIYYGYGPSAFSFDGKARYGNGEGLSEYLEDPLGREAEREILSREDLAFEYIMLGLRMAEGISPGIYEGRFGVPFLEKYGDTVEKYLKSGHMRFENGHYRLTDAGMQISNAILVEFLGEE